MNNPETLLLLTLRYGLVSGKISPRDFGILPQVLLGASAATGGHMRHMRVQPGPETPLFPALGNPANGQLFLTTHGPNRELGLWLRRGDAGDGELIGRIIPANFAEWGAEGFSDFISSMWATRCWAVPAALQLGTEAVDRDRAVQAAAAGAAVMHQAVFYADDLHVVYGLLRYHRTYERFYSRIEDDLFFADRWSPAGCKTEINDIDESPAYGAGWHIIWPATADIAQSDVSRNTPNGKGGEHA